MVVNKIIDSRMPKNTTIVMILSHILHHKISILDIIHNILSRVVSILKRIDVLKFKESMIK